MKILSFLPNEIRRLNHIRRYSSYPVIRSENVAEHSFWCAFYANLIALDINRKDYGNVVDIGRLLGKALLHDIEESQTGDLVRTFKYHSKEGRSLFKTAEEELLVESFNDIPAEISEKLLYEWRHSKNETLEGQIVQFADILCVYLYCIEEIKLGNDHMLDVLNGAMVHLGMFEGNKHLKGYCDEIRENLQPWIAKKLLMI